MLRGTMCLIILAVLSAPLAPRLLLNARPAQRAQDKWPKEITNSIGMNLVRIPAGKFQMGSTKGEGGEPNEHPQHEVAITKAFHMGVYLVTQAEYQKVMKENP